MSNEAVQVITNPNQLRSPREKTPPAKAGDDFFKGDNSGFGAHRDRLVVSVQAIMKAITSDEWLRVNHGVAHLRVSMQPRAIAKSHRPQKSVFKPNWAPHVATAGIGEPIYAVTPISLDHTLGQLMAAPVDVPERIDKKTGNLVPRPSRLRCEVSAIGEIDLWGVADKREFGAIEGARWLTRGGTGGCYIVSFFPIAIADSDPSLAASQQKAMRALENDLRELGVDARARPTLGRGTGALVSLRVLERDTPSEIQLGLFGTPVGSKLVANKVTTDDADRHQAALQVLDRSTLVRDIALPPLPRRDESVTADLDVLFAPGLPARESGDYARVGVIDGGISDSVGDWIEERWGQLADGDRDFEHGTFISGLLVAANEFNPKYLGDQTTGCGVIDVDVLPTDPGGTGAPFVSYYPNGVIDFMDEVEAAVKKFRTSLGVRVFNFSLNFESPGDPGRYGYAARRLDQIARDNDVIFVISAGNLAPSQQRPEWPDDPAQGIATLVADPAGTISEPAESLFNISVSALNPPGLQVPVPYALARYSRRGPGLRGGTKPDFAHVGGSGTPDPISGHGLCSVDGSGEQITGAGTSYAAPLVARQLADLDALIQGEVPREVLLALLVHYAQLPKTLSGAVLLPSARDIAGFGVPTVAEEMLQRPDSEITLVVHSTVLPREEHTLKFSWPEALVNSGKCRGNARLTLVARPVIAYEHGDERIRVNIDAKLMQQQADGGYKNAVYPTNQPRTRNAPRTERELLQEAHKWQVVKSFAANLRGKGVRSNWKLLIEYLERADDPLPAAGVEFAAILTIADDKGEAPVFHQMRQHLGDLGVRTGDIRTSIRSRIPGMSGVVGP